MSFSDDARSEEGYAPPSDPRHVASETQSLAWLRNIRRDLTPDAPPPRPRAGRLARRVGAEDASTVVKMIDGPELAGVVAGVLVAAGAADPPGLAVAVLEAVAMWLLDAE